jgi:hypothetical protein
MFRSRVKLTKPVIFFRNARSATSAIFQVLGFNISDFPAVCHHFSG